MLLATGLGHALVPVTSLNATGTATVLRVTICNCNMGSGEKTSFRLPGPKPGGYQHKVAVEQHAASEVESQLEESIKDNDWSELEGSYIQMMENHEECEEELRNHITKLLQVFCRHSD